MSKLLTSVIAGGGFFLALIVALVKLFPERSGIIINYQKQAIESLQAECKRQAQLIADLENQIDELRQELAAQRSLG